MCAIFEIFNEELHRKIQFITETRVERNLNILKTIKEVDSSVKTYSSLYQRKQNQYTPDSDGLREKRGKFQRYKREKHYYK